MAHMTIDREPYSLNETKENRQQTNAESEPRYHTMVGGETPNVPGTEPTESADQQEAARSNLSEMVSANGGQNVLVYALAAGIGLWAVNKVFL